VKQGMGVLLLVVLIPITCWFHLNTSPTVKEALPPLPKKEVAKLSTLEFKPLLADYYLVKVAQIYGGKTIPTPAQVKWMTQALALSLDLDPYYLEPYYFAANVLPWKGKADRSISLLKKGLEYRKGDWRISFYLGFLLFYFKKEPVEGAKYLAMAAHAPEAPSYLPLLVSRLYSEKGRFSAAIIYLQGLYQSLQDPKLKEAIKKRLQTLTTMEALEKLAKEYKERYDFFPRTLQDLVRVGLLSRAPRDPYGGRFYFKKDGTVWTTSKLREVRRK